MNSPFIIFDNKVGIVLKATYSNEHTKINDTVIQTPVSTETATMMALPSNRDQRTEIVIPILSIKKIY